jgi:hypothetical protein
MNELAAIIREWKMLIAALPAGPERDQRQGQLDRMAERLRALPRKVADQGPFATRDEAHAVLTKEFAYVVAAIDEAN